MLRLVSPHPGVQTRGEGEEEVMGLLVWDGGQVTTTVIISTLGPGLGAGQWSCIIFVASLRVVGEGATIRAVSTSCQSSH